METTTTFDVALFHLLIKTQIQIQTQAMETTTFLLVFLCLLLRQILVKTLYKLKVNNFSFYINKFPTTNASNLQRAKVPSLVKLIIKVKVKSVLLEMLTLKRDSIHRSPECTLQLNVRVAP